MKTLFRQLVALVFLLLGIATIGFAQKPESYVQQGPHNVAAMAFSSDNRLLATGDTDGARLYDLSTNREVRTLRHYDVRAVAFSPDAKFLATAGTEQKSARSGETPYTVKIWTVGEGSLVQTLSAINSSTNWKSQVRSLNFSPNGKLLIGGCDGQMIAIWKLDQPGEPRLIKTPSPVFRTALSGDGKIVAAGSQDQKTTLWDIESGAVIRTLAGHAKAVTALAFSPDSKTLATGSYDYTINLWDVGSGALLRTFKGKSQIHSLAFSVDGGTLASASGYAVLLFDVATGTEREKFGPFYLNVSVVAYSPDGQTLAGVSLDGRLVLWDSGTAKPVRTFERRHDEITSVALLFDDKVLAAETGSNTQLWNYQSGEYERTTEARMSSIFFGAGAYSSDYKLAALADASGSVTVADVEAKKELRRLSGHDLFVSAVAFGHEDKLIATGGADGVIKIWEAATGNTLHTINTNPEEKKITVTSGLSVTDPATMFKNLIGALAFSPDGKILAGVIHGTSGGGSLRLWDTASGRLLRSMPGNADFISAIAFDSAGRRLASGDDKGVINVWDVEGGTDPFTLAGHAGRVTSLRFAPREVLISGGWDAKVKLWDLGERRELVSLISGNNGEWLAIAPDGLFDGSPGAWNEILWRFSPNLADIVPVELFFNEYFYPTLLADILSGRRPRSAQDIRQKDRRQPMVSLALAKPPAATSKAVDERIITLKIEVAETPAGGGKNKGSGARDVRLFRNGSLVKVWRGDVLKGSGKTVLETTLSVVEGENRLTAYAFNGDNIKSADAALVVKGAPSLAREGTAYVIAIGVNQYQNKEFDLKYAVPDARSFGEEFQRAQNALGKFAKTEVITLLNSDATKTNLLRALGRLAGKDTSPLTAGDSLEKIKPAQPEDAVVIYFSGHGTAQQSRFYLIPHDLGYAGARDDLGKDEKAMKSLLDHSLSDVEMEQAFEKVDAAQLLLVIDACHSGQALESDEKRRGPMNSRGLAQLAYEKGMYILTASQSYQVAIGSKKLGHGYLTYALVEEGLKSAKADEAPKDGQVLIREWLDFATRRVSNMQEDPAKEIRDLVQPEAASNRKAEVQRPRVFYRRETEAQPMIIAVH